MLILTSLLLCIFLITTFILIFFLYRSYRKRRVDIDAVYRKISAVSELGVLKIRNRDICYYTKGRIALIDKHNFNMCYTSTVKLGIEFKNIKIHKIEKVLIVELPPLKIFDVYIDERDIKFYDVQKGFWCQDGKEALVEAITVAKKQARENVERDEDLTIQAYEHTKNIIRGMLSMVVDKDTVIEFK